MDSKIMDFLSGKKVCILGFGKEGKSTFNYIKKHNPNFKLFIHDQNENLIEENEFLREQLSLKEQNNSNMQKLLDQQQQLTLQANQQIEKLQEQLQLAYTEETSEDESTTILSEETESIEKHTKKKQKWWQLWK